MVLKNNVLWMPEDVPATLIAALPTLELQSSGTTTYTLHLPRLLRLLLLVSCKASTFFIVTLLCSHLFEMSFDRWTGVTQID